MKISPIKPFAIKPIIKNSSAPLAFKANIIEGDCFSPSIKNKYAKIKNLEGKDVYVTLTKQSSRIPYGHSAFEYVIKHNEENLGYAIALDREDYDGLFLSDLYTQENKSRQYKGLGTELLKCIVEESYKKGFGGKILCCAYHEDSPFVFYYKNNFRLYNKDNFVQNPALYNASLQYITKNNLEVFDILPKNRDLLFFELDRKGADALMNNKRLYEDAICDEVGSMSINGQKYSAQYIKFPDKKESYLQIINEDASFSKLALILALEENNDFLGKKSFKIVNGEKNGMQYHREVGNFAKSLLDDLAQQYL